MNPCFAIPVCLHALFLLSSSGWYTPEAARELYRVPIVQGETYGALATFDGEKITFRDGYWSGSTYHPGYAAFTMRHEFNHYFDLTSDAPPSSNPSFCRISLAIQNYPARNRSWKLSAQNCIERYAYLGEYPWLFPQLRQFYPQYTDLAFTPQ